MLTHVAGHVAGHALGNAGERVGEHVAPMRNPRELRPLELPAPPQIALQVMRACTRPEADGQGIAALISTDPGLTAHVLAVVNSAYFGFSGEVRTVAHAVAILGRRPLRNYVLCIAVREALAGDVLHGNDPVPFWEGSLRRAVAAKALAGEIGLNPDECFTVGLLQDVGLAALFHVHPERAGHWLGVLRADPDERLDMERALFDTTHDQVGAMLAESWGLPGDLAHAIAGHHRAFGTWRREPSLRAMQGAARAADWLAAAYAATGVRNVLGRAREVLAEELDLSSDRVDELLRALPGEVREAAAALGFPVPGGDEYEDLLRAANLSLAEENRGHQELTWQLRAALEKRDDLAGRIRRELQTARVVQRALLPRPLEASASAPAELPYSGINAPARELSGDFFDYFPIDEARSYFCLADVSGKGMDAALLMAKASSLFHCLGKIVHDPCKLLGLINTELLETSVRGMFVTMAAGIYDARRQVVSLVNAGHPPALVLDAGGGVTVADVDAPPLGIVPEHPFVAVEHEIRDRALYLFSDGLLEAPGPRGERLGYAGIVEVLREFHPVGLAERPARVLTSVARSHDLTTDDVSLLVVQP